MKTHATPPQHFPKLHHLSNKPKPTLTPTAPAHSPQTTNPHPHKTISSKPPKPKKAKTFTNYKKSKKNKKAENKFIKTNPQVKRNNIKIINAETLTLN